jgi:chorismate mutase / prephenate dehydratase
MDPETMAEHPPRPLEEIRVDIDALDLDLVRLLSRRVELAQEVGRFKGIEGRPFFTPERERAIYDRLAEVNPGPMKTKQMAAVFREIISAARAAEKPLVCAYWGPAGTFTHLAGIETFGSSTEFKSCDEIPDVFQAVERGEADYGVVPVENSVVGIVPLTLDMFPQTNVKICAEVYIPIHHHLVSTATSLEDIERVYAFFQPVQQCRLWLKSHLPNVEIIDVSPTARAAQRALEDPQGAAICNRLASETVGIPILVEHIEDNPANRTRFLILGYNEPAKTGRDKTSVMFNVRNRPGELVKALGAFDGNGVNLTMIESRPAQRATFEYLFYVDCDGHRQDESMRRALDVLRTLALETVILGSYPRRDPLDV